jgi:hypothetical protein
MSYQPVIYQAEGNPARRGMRDFSLDDDQALQHLGNFNCIVHRGPLLREETNPEYGARKLVGTSCTNIVLNDTSMHMDMKRALLA